MTCISLSKNALLPAAKVEDVDYTPRGSAHCSEFNKCLSPEHVLLEINDENTCVAWLG